MRQSGIAVPPRRYYLGCTGVFEQADSASEIAVFADDMTADERRVIAESKLEGSVYELRKFLRLALDAMWSFGQALVFDGQRGSLVDLGGTVGVWVGQATRPSDPAMCDDVPPAWFEVVMTGSFGP